MCVFPAPAGAVKMDTAVVVVSSRTAASSGSHHWWLTFPLRVVKICTSRFRGNAAGRRPFHHALPWGPVTVMVTSSEPEWTASSKPSQLPMLVPPPPCGTVAPPRFW